MEQDVVNKPCSLVPINLKQQQLINRIATEQPHSRFLQHHYRHWPRLRWWGIHNKPQCRTLDSMIWISRPCSTTTTTTTTTTTITVLLLLLRCFFCWL